MPPASSPCQLRLACWNSGFDRSVTVALGLAFCSIASEISKIMVKPFDFKACFKLFLRWWQGLN
ncbi:hypothetical protein SLEP1_g3646 [Rubroshorea leprosula]|uniref:Uncharacterized protein n=1 Tax=Rubroshorea leprosula TaxID=152421 RepID=A0AAV5HVF7_9ROSI|nr:hypothetical protein SLEP1_g3646 [Rubroshorea leprosula]